MKLAEGEDPIEGMVLVEFPDMNPANRWYESPFYDAFSITAWEDPMQNRFFLDGGMTVSADECSDENRVSASDARKG